MLKKIILLFSVIALVNLPLVSSVFGSSCPGGCHEPSGNGGGGGSDIPQEIKDYILK